MRLGLVALIAGFLAIFPAHAETYKIVAPDSSVSKSVARLVEEAYRQLGHDTEFAYLPAERSVREVNRGKYDAELVRITGLENEFPNLVHVQEPVYTLQISAFVRSDSDIEIATWEDIGDRRVGYPRGYRILNIRTRGMNVIKTKDPETTVKMVKGGRMEIGFLLTSDAVALAEKLGGISVIEPPIEESTLYHYVHVKHRRLVPKLEEVLIEMNDSGRSQEILSQGS